MFMNVGKGLESVQEDPKPQGTHTVRLVLAEYDRYDHEEYRLREHAFSTVAEANRAVESMDAALRSGDNGEFTLIACRGCHPSEIGFGDGMAY